MTSAIVCLAKGRDGDRINAMLAAVCYGFSLPLRWFEESRAHCC
jgi:hypothetical protein